MRTTLRTKMCKSYSESSMRSNLALRTILKTQMRTVEKSNLEMMKRKEKERKNKTSNSVNELMHSITNNTLN